MNLPSVIPAKRRFHKKRKPATQAPPAALTLVSASYDHTALTLTMVFSRAIDISGMDGSVIEVDDGTFHNAQYFAVGHAVLSDPVTLVVGVDLFTGGSPAGVHLTSPECGIVAVDDGTPWAGVTNVGLPFP